MRLYGREHLWNEIIVNLMLYSNVYIYPRGIVLPICELAAPEVESM